jgi:3-methylcrotonyl-CoA carboxylase alpha subunit
MFKKILVANRGEIALRVIFACRELGIKTVAVYSEADENSLHVRFADEDICIGPARSSDSYLNVPAIISAAEITGADALHPGYGFLSESAYLAEVCEACHIRFIGPDPSVIRLLGDKSKARRAMKKAGVPMLPGSDGPVESEAAAIKIATQIGYPVIIKAVAGGGGRGMRIVKNPAELPHAFKTAQREAESAFGVGDVYIEKYLEAPRHIEFQILGDHHGNVVHLGERECSIQRRHQKLLEESPSIAVSDKVRRKMGAVVVDAARAVQYTNAGTFEFLMDEKGNFFFMEVNTRVQVEHPVTEMVTGLDLVEWQLRVAAGEKLPLKQQDLRITGHAIEARLYAEDPARDFLPATGRIVHLAFPSGDAGIRVDAGVEAGDEITPWYDPMIAKLVAHGRDRAEALARLRSALAATEIAGPVTNVGFLGRLAACKAFAEADLDTGLIERHRDSLLRQDPPSARLLAAAAFAELAEEESEARRHAAGSGDPHSPWHAVDGWRLNQESHHDFRFTEGDIEHAVRIRFLDTGLEAQIGEGRHTLSGRVLGDWRLQLHLDGAAFKARAVRAGAEWHLFCDGGSRRLALKPDLPSGDADTRSGSLAAPMPGKVIQVMTKAGARVAKGDALLILEAMKMEHTITAPADGVVKEVHYGAGEQVLEGAELISLE